MKLKLLIYFLFQLSSCNTNKNGDIIGLNQNIHHDDLEYSVSDYIVTRFLKVGNDTLKAQGAFYLVNFRVENRALRVTHTWDNSIYLAIPG